MISVEWFENETCENCGKVMPHCARISFETMIANQPESSVSIDTSVFDFCSDCVEDLKKRLS